MNRIKQWIRNKFISFLRIDKLTESFTTHETVTNIRLRDIDWKLETVDNDLKYLNKEVSHFNGSIDAIHRTVENVVHIGTDVYQSNQGHSWAVVCVEGKMNLVKFVPLDRRDARDILDFLKRFEAGRHCIDTPYKEIFYDGLFKFD
jgi:hypothetical protein